MHPEIGNLGVLASRLVGLGYRVAARQCIIPGVGVWLWYEVRQQLVACTPKFQWLPEKTEHGPNELKLLGAPFLARYARVVPTSERPYDMKITGDGGGLLSLLIQHPHVAQEPDPPPWQLQPSGIAYRANQPVGIIRVLIVAKEPEQVQLTEPEFRCR